MELRDFVLVVALVLVVIGIALIFFTTMTALGIGVGIVGMIGVFGGLYVEVGPKDADQSDSAR